MKYLRLFGNYWGNFWSNPWKITEWFLGVLPAATLGRILERSVGKVSKENFQDSILLKKLQNVRKIHFKGIPNGTHGKMAKEIFERISERSIVKVPGNPWRSCRSNNWRNFLSIDRWISRKNTWECFRRNHWKSSWKFNERSFCRNHWKYSGEHMWRIKAVH